MALGRALSPRRLIVFEPRVLLKKRAAVRQRLSLHVARIEANALVIQTCNSQPHRHAKRHVRQHKKPAGVHAPTHPRTRAKKYSLSRRTSNLAPAPAEAPCCYGVWPRRVACESGGIMSRGGYAVPQEVRAHTRRVITGRRATIFDGGAPRADGALLHSSSSLMGAPPGPTAPSSTAPPQWGRPRIGGARSTHLDALALTWRTLRTAPGRGYRPCMLSRYAHGQFSTEAFRLPPTLIVHINISTKLCPPRSRRVE